MSLLEWILEPVNSGPVGKVEIEPSEPEEDGEPPRKWLIWIGVLIGLLLAAIGLYWLFNDQSVTGTKSVLYRLGGFALYIVISHYMTVTTEYTNLGWLGGVLNNPFRISDNFNRWLLFIQVILLPGKLIAFSLVMSWLLDRYLYKKLKM